MLSRLIFLLIKNFIINRFTFDFLDGSIASMLMISFWNNVVFTVGLEPHEHTQGLGYKSVGWIHTLFYLHTVSYWVSCE
jgi:hypothetical protein